MLKCTRNQKIHCLSNSLPLFNYENLPVFLPSIPATQVFSSCFTFSTTLWVIPTELTGKYLGHKTELLETCQALSGRWEESKHRSASVRCVDTSCSSTQYSGCCHIACLLSRVRVKKRTGCILRVYSYFYWKRNNYH